MKTKSYNLVQNNKRKKNFRKQRQVTCHVCASKTSNQYVFDDAKLLSLLLFALKWRLCGLLNAVSELTGDTNPYLIEVLPALFQSQSVLIVTPVVACKADSFLYELGTRKFPMMDVRNGIVKYATKVFAGKGPTCWDWYPGLSRENNFIWGLFNSYYFCDGTFTLLPMIC